MKSSTAKALEILLKVADNMPQPTVVGELAEQMGISQPTCSAHLKLLAQYGLVEALERRKGYVLGPAAHTLASREPHRRDLLVVAEEILEQLGQRLEEGLVFSTWCNSQVRVLWKYEANREVVINHRKLFLGSVYFTASGRVLLAFQDEREQRRFAREQGLPTWEWPEVDTEEKLWRELARIRADRQAVILKNEMVSLAVPVTENGRAVAAIGLSVPRHRWSEATGTTILRELTSVAAEMSDRWRAGREKHSTQGVEQ